MCARSKIHAFNFMDPPVWQRTLLTCQVVLAVLVPNCERKEGSRGAMWLLSYLKIPQGFWTRSYIHKRQYASKMLLTNRQHIFQNNIYFFNTSGGGHVCNNPQRDCRIFFYFMNVRAQQNTYSTSNVIIFLSFSVHVLYIAWLVMSIIIHVLTQHKYSTMKKYH